MKTRNIHRQRITRIYPWHRKTDGYETDSVAETVEEKLEMLASISDEILQRLGILEGKKGD